VGLFFCESLLSFFFSFLLTLPCLSSLIIGVLFVMVWC
jgi:hypothetical protein